MIRFFDFLISLSGITLLSPFLFLLFILIYFENKSPLFFQKRVGKDGEIFTLIKFRTMSLDTVDKPTHLVDKSKVSNLGRILRKTKIDELPQLINVIKGDMSLVGPRPCLVSQKELINLRFKYDVIKSKPGITGLSQIKKVDMSDPYLLTKMDSKMIEDFNFFKYFSYIFLTVFGIGLGDNIKIPNR